MKLEHANINIDTHKNMPPRSLAMFSSDRVNITRKRKIKSFKKSCHLNETKVDKSSKISRYTELAKRLSLPK